MTNDIDRRLDEHQKGFDTTCYTYLRRPVILKYCAEYKYVNDAIRREKQIKGWSRKKKEALIMEDYEELMRLAESYSKRAH